MPSNRTPWYRWRFSLLGTFGAFIFLSVAWDQIVDTTESLGSRIAGATVFLLFSMLLFFSEWRLRSAHEFRMPSRSDNDDC